MHKILTFLATAFLLCGNSYAAGPEYFKVELIIFSHLTKAGYYSETWPTYLPPLNTQGTVQLAPVADDDDISTTYQNLPIEDLSLDKISEKIATKTNFEILVHTAWLQPYNQKALNIHILGGTNYTATENSSNDIDATDNWELSGLFKVQRRNKFFVVTTNLYLDEPLARLPTQHHFGFDFSHGQVHQFQLNQTRRIRPKELNYFDNPLFGALVIVTPLDNDEK